MVQGHLYVCAAQKHLQSEEGFFQGKKDETEGQADCDLNIKRPPVMQQMYICIVAFVYLCIVLLLFVQTHPDIFIFNTSTLYKQDKFRITNCRKLSISTQLQTNTLYSLLP